MLKNGEVNPLNLWNMRQVEGTCPPHFERVEFDLYMHQTPKEYSDWIWENLEGRFWLGEMYNYDTTVTDTYGPDKRTQRITMSTCAAFELPSEATMFAMCLSQISPPNSL